MADVTATAHVFPSAQDLEGGQPNGWGETLYEKNLASFWLAGLRANNYTISGALLPASDADLTITVPAGKFWLDGHYVEAAATNITVGASTITYLFAKLLKDVNGNVSSVAYETNTSGTAPADATPIGSLVSSGSAITGTTDLRILGPGHGIMLSSGTSWVFPAGITRIFVEIFGAGGGGGGGGEGGNQTTEGTAGGNGASGGTGGTTTFGSLTANGGPGGSGGLGGGSIGGAPSAIGHGSASGGHIALTGKGMPGGGGGHGGGADIVSRSQGQNGARGGHGGYAAGLITGSVGSSISYAIGSGGGGGAGGSGNSSPNGGPGAAGVDGRIVIHY